MTWLSHCQHRLHDRDGLALGGAIISTDQRNLPLERGGLKRGLIRDPRVLGRMLEAALGKRDLISKLGRYEMQLRTQVLKVLRELKSASGK